jgi:hypothetical protein
MSDQGQEQWADLATTIGKLTGAPDISSSGRQAQAPKRARAIRAARRVGHVADVEAVRDAHRGGDDVAKVALQLRQHQALQHQLRRKVLVVQRYLAACQRIETVPSASHKPAAGGCTLDLRLSGNNRLDVNAQSTQAPFP